MNDRQVSACHFSKLFEQVFGDRFVAVEAHHMLDLSKVVHKILTVFFG